MLLCHFWPKTLGAYISELSFWSCVLLKRDGRDASNDCCWITRVLGRKKGPIEKGFVHKNHQSVNVIKLMRSLSDHSKRLSQQCDWVLLRNSKVFSSNQLEVSFDGINVNVAMSHRRDVVGGDTGWQARRIVIEEECGNILKIFWPARSIGGLVWNRIVSLRGHSSNTRHFFFNTILPNCF